MSVDKESIVLMYFEKKDPVLRDKIVVSYSGLVECIARKLAYKREDLDDLIQVGNIGLLKSIERYEPQKKISFSTFATPNIIGEIRHYFRDKNRLVKIPRRLAELYSKIRYYIRYASQELGRAPTIAEIAAELHVSQENVLESLEAGQTTHVLSLDTPYSEYESGESAPSLLDSLGMENVEEGMLDKESLKQAILQLTERERKLIYYRFFEGLTQNEIAGKMKISQMHVSRILTNALSELRKYLKFH